MSSKININRCRNVKEILNQNFILYWNKGVVLDMFSDGSYLLTSIHPPFKTNLCKTQKLCLI